MIEFYGEISDYTKRRAEKLKRKYYAKWLFVLACIPAALCVVSAVTSGKFIGMLVFAILLVGAGIFLFFSPPGRSYEKQKWIFRVVIDGDTLIFTQYIGQKTVEKKRKIDAVKRVIKTDFCYFVVFNDIGNAVILERCLLKKGTFDLLESIFRGKICEKQMD